MIGVEVKQDLLPQIFVCEQQLQARLCFPSQANFNGKKQRITKRCNRAVITFRAFEL